MKTINKAIRLYRKVRNYYDVCATTKEADIKKFIRDTIRTLLKEQNAPKSLVNGFMNENMKSLTMPLVNASTLDLFGLKELELTPDTDGRVTVDMLAILNSLITVILCYRDRVTGKDDMDLVQLVTYTVIGIDRADLYLNTDISKEKDIDMQRAENAVTLVNWVLDNIIPVVNSIHKYLTKEGTGTVYTTFSMVTNKSFIFSYFEIEDKKV